VSDNKTSAPTEPIALAARLMGLHPRLGLAISQTSYRQLREVSGLDYSLIDYQGVFGAAIQFAIAWWLDPMRALSAQAELLAGSLALFEARCRDDEEFRACQPAFAKPFLDKAWREDPSLAMAKDLYALCAEWALAQIRHCASLSDHDKQKLAFYTRQLLCAFAPTNVPFINPKVRTRALETGGESLVDGLENLLHDLEQGSGLFPIT